MDKKITLNKLISYVLTHATNTGTSAPVGVVCNGTGDGNSTQINTLKTLKNKLSGSTYKPLPYPGEDKSIIDLPKKLKKMFEPFIGQVKRHPVLSSKYSLLHSVLYLLHEDVTKIPEQELEEVLKQLNIRLINDIKYLFNKFGYKQLNWSNKETVQTLKDYKNNIVSLRIVADYFHTNIIVLNANEDKIYAVYPEQSYNVFKPTLVLGYCDEQFEPLTYEDNKLWMYNHKPIKKLVNVDKRYIGVLHADFSVSKDPKETKEPKVFEVGPDSLDQYLDAVDKKEAIEAVEVEENTFSEIYPDEDEEEYSATEIDKTDVLLIEDGEVGKEGIFYKHKRKTSTASSDTKSTDIDSSAIKKMKLKDLQNLAVEHGVAVRHNSNSDKCSRKLKTKAELCEALLAL